MTNSALRSALPYVVGLAIAAVLYVLAGQIEYTPRPGILGPDFWPKAAIGLMAVVCALEIMRAVVGARSQAFGISETLEADEGAQPARTYPGLLIGGVALVAIYALVVEIFGFLLTTFFFLAAFMYLGRYRNHVAVWSFSAVVTLLSALIFIRFAYVSLPRGWPPFDAVTDGVRIMLGG
jgi:hypothetical protein